MLKVEIHAGKDFTLVSEGTMRELIAKGAPADAVIRDVRTVDKK